MVLRLLLALAFAVVLAVFAGQNAAPVPVRFLGWQASASLVVVVAVAAAAGAALVALLTAFRQLGLAMRLRGEHAQVRRLEAELQALREERQRLRARLEAAEEQLRRLREAASAGDPGGGDAGAPPHPRGPWPGP